MESSVTLSYSKTADGEKTIDELEQNSDFFIHARLETEEVFTKPLKLILTVTIPTILIPGYDLPPKIVRKELKFVRSGDKYTAHVKITKKDWTDPDDK